MMQNMIQQMIISTHSLTRRLTNTDFLYCQFESISTHSLTRRLTYGYVCYKQFYNISTHSLTRRLTLLRRGRRLYLIFQLTASQGG